MRMTAREVALIACTAAVYVVLSYLPGFPVIGAKGAKIGIVSSVVLVFGFLLGPSIGTLATLLGAIISRVLKGAGPFVWLTLPCMPLSAFITGALSRSRLGPVKGWEASAVTLAALIVAWYGTWVGQAVPYFPIMHWIGLLIILVFRGKLAEFFQSEEKRKLVACVALCSYSATMTTHMYGNLAFLVAVELVILKVSQLPLLFMSIIPIAAIERLIFTAISTIIGVPIILTLRARIPELMGKISLEKN